MMHKNVRLILYLALLLLAQSSWADDYKEYAKQVREEVWGWNKPEFKNYEVPDRYKNESAVILACHENVEIKSKRIVALIRLYYTKIERRMVKINDKVSLDEFSDLSFKEKTNFATSGLGSKNRLETIIGVRIIKPDGTIKEVNIDEAISVTEGKKEKESHKKLAIPDLQIGDIIDYFFCDNAVLDEKNPPASWFPFYSSYPTLSYSVHCELNTKHVTIEYETLNGAKDFTRSTNDDGETILDLKETNLLKVEKGRWISYLRDLPMIRMNILNNKSTMVGKSMNARKNGIYKKGDNLSSDDIILDAEYRSSNGFYKDAAKPLLKDLKKPLKKYLEANSELSERERAVYIHDYLYFKYPSNSSFYNPTAYLCIYTLLLKEFKIPYENILMTNKYGTRMEDILEADDLEDAVKVGDYFYTYPRRLETAGELPPGNQGQEACIIRRMIPDKKKLKYDKNFKREYFNLPESTIEQNKAISISNISFSPNNPLELIIDRNMTCTGSLKKDFQQILVSYEDWDRTMRKHLSVKESREEEMQENRKSRKYIEDMKTSFEKRRTSQKDSMAVEIANRHGFEPKEVIEYEMSSPGLTPQDPDLKYTVKYTVDGLVKKAGNNLIIDAGKLIGRQWEPTEEDRRRTVNAYLSTTRVYEDQISVEIADGYEAQDIEKLNLTIDNEYGSFHSSAALDGPILKINVRKEYKKSFIPVTEWDQLIEMLHKANNFYVQSIVLRKKSF